MGSTKTDLREWLDRKRLRQVRVRGWEQKPAPVSESLNPRKARIESQTQLVNLYSSSHSKRHAEIYHSLLMNDKWPFKESMARSHHVSFRQTPLQHSPTAISSFQKFKITGNFCQISHQPQLPWPQLQNIVILAVGQGQAIFALHITWFLRPRRAQAWTTNLTSVCSRNSRVEIVTHTYVRITVWCCSESLPTATLLPFRVLFKGQ